MATDLAEKAKEAFVDDDFQLSFHLYTQAIHLSPKNAHLYADRAQANIKLNNFTDAVADASKAIELDPLIAKAYLRKGTACFKLKEYHTAKAALVTGASLLQNDSRFTKLLKECEDRIAEEAGGPNESEKQHKTTDSTLAPVESETSDISVGCKLQTLQGDNESNQMKEMAQVKPKYRHSFYQKPEEVVVTVFAKSVPAKNVAIDFGEQILSVTIDLPGEDVYCFQPRLFGKIVPEKCKYEVLTTKIEIRLVKAEAINWTSLEYSKEVTVRQNVIVPSVVAQRPSYPSSKPRGTNWDKLEAEVKKEEKDEKLDGDAALNKLFGDIYKNADEDMRRAMNKSFVESNGTVLSTNWKDVGAKKVEGSAPDGMELKKWEY
ncbi:hypothetical protein LguiB_034753 [Lonicera macranthoides]